MRLSPHSITAIAAIIGVLLAFNENPDISPLYNLLGLIILAAAYITALHLPHLSHSTTKPPHSRPYNDTNIID